MLHIFAAEFINRVNYVSLVILHSYVSLHAASCDGHLIMLRGLAVCHILGHLPFGDPDVVDISCQPR